MPSTTPATDHRRRSTSRTGPLRRLAAPVVACAAILAAATACGGDDAATTTTRPAGTASTEGGSATSTTGADSGAGGSSAGTAGEQGDAAAVKPADGKAPAERTVTFTADKRFDPAQLEVPVGELVTFVAAPDAGTHAVRFGDSTDTYTISGGLVESFTIGEPGTYTVTEDLTNATMTLTVR